MKALRPAAAIASILLASPLLVLLAACGDFWQNPNGSTSTGTTPTTTTLSPFSTSITAGQSDTLTASVSPTAATGTVSFLSNGSSIGNGTLTSGTATSSPTFTTAGSYTVTADYSGDSTYASSDSTAATITVGAAAASSSHPGTFNSANATRITDLVLNSASPWSVDASLHVHNIAVVVLNNGTVENIDGGGHCVYYSGKAYIAAGESNSTGVYELSGGGYLAPEGTADLDCE